jgi:hypothetical protein
MTLPVWHARATLERLAFAFVRLLFYGRTQGFRQSLRESIAIRRIQASVGMDQRVRRGSRQHAAED